MKLLLLHPLSAGWIDFCDDLRALSDECFAPTLYEAGDDIDAWAHAAVDAVGDGPFVMGLGDSAWCEGGSTKPPRPPHARHGRCRERTVSVGRSRPGGEEP